MNQPNLLKLMILAQTIGLLVREESHGFLSFRRINNKFFAPFQAEAVMGILCDVFLSRYSFF